MAGTLTKTKTAVATTEVLVVLAGGQTSDAVFTEGLPYASMHIYLASGTAVTSVTPQYSNDNVNYVSGTAISTLPTMLDLYGTGAVPNLTSPARYVRFQVIGGDGTSVVTIVLVLMGQRG